MENYKGTNMTQIADLGLKTSKESFCDTNRRFGHKNSKGEFL